MILDKQQVTEEIKGEIKKYLETNDNENTTQNLWDAAKAVLRGKFAAAAAAAKSLQSCPTLCDPIDGSQPGSTFLGILQARTLKWVAISFFNA